MIAGLIELADPLASVGLRTILAFITIAVPSLILLLRLRGHMLARFLQLKVLFDALLITLLRMFTWDGESLAHDECLIVVVHLATLETELFKESFQALAYSWLALIAQFCSKYVA